MIIASYNLDSLDDTEEDPRDFAARVAALRPKLVGLHADILCLQEIHSQKIGSLRRLRALDRLLERTEYSAFYRAQTVGAVGRPADVHNLAILSRYPILRSEQISHVLVPPLPCPQLHSVGAGEPVYWDRPFLHAEIDDGGGRRLQMVNLHLRAPIAAHVPEGREHGSWRAMPLWAEGFFRAALKRIGQALEIRLFIDRIFDDQPDALICVCGDFNAEGAEMPLRLIRGDPDDTGSPDLEWRRLLPLDHSGPSTIHAGRPMRPDHLLASLALARHHRRSELVNAGLPDDTETGAVDSPHAPILAEFDFD